MSLMGYMVNLFAYTASQVDHGKQQWYHAVRANKIRVRIIDRHAYVSFGGKFQFSCPQVFLWDCICDWYRKKESEIIKGDLWVR